MPAPLRLALAVAALTLAGCGGEDRAGGPAADTRDVDQAFLQAMVPHHASAVDMAAVAGREAESVFVEDLAAKIGRTQVGEMAVMRRIHERLYRAPLQPDMSGHDVLGLSAEQAGMNHMDGAAAIRGKRPFDRAFVDEMVPHHEGAVRMAEVVRERGRDRELRELAGEIVRSQRREIRAMNRFREREFGGPVPAAPDGGHPGHHPG